MIPLKFWTPEARTRRIGLYLQGPRRVRFSARFNLDVLLLIHTQWHSLNTLLAKTTKSGGIGQLPCPQPSPHPTPTLISFSWWICSYPIQWLSNRPPYHLSSMHLFLHLASQTFFLTCCLKGISEPVSLAPNAVKSTWKPIRSIPKKKRNGTLQWTAKVLRTKEAFPHPNFTPYQAHSCSPFYHTQLPVPCSSLMRVVPLWRFSQSPILIVSFILTRYYQLMLFLHKLLQEEIDYPVVKKNLKLSLPVNRPWGNQLPFSLMYFFWLLVLFLRNQRSRFINVCYWLDPALSYVFFRPFKLIHRIEHWDRVPTLPSFSSHFFPILSSTVRRSSSRLLWGWEWPLNFFRPI